MAGVPVGFTVVGARLPAARAFVREEVARARAVLGGAARSFNGLVHTLAAPELARGGLRRATPGEQLAVAVAVVHDAREAKRLGQFEHIARGPGLPRRLVATFVELRGAGLGPEAVAGTDPVLAALLEDWLKALAGERLVDHATVVEAGVRALGSGAVVAGMPVAGAPLVLLDPSLGDRVATRFAAALAARAGETLITLPSGDGATARAVERMGAVPWSDAAASGPSSDPIDTERPVPGATRSASRPELADREPTDPEDAVARAQRTLFEPAPGAAPETLRGVSFAAAPGPAAEAIECVRFLLRHAEAGVSFDRMAVLLPHPPSHVAAFEEAFDRAGIPGHFEIRAFPADPSRRALLALLDCAGEDLSAERFAEYLSIHGPPPGAALAPPPPGAGPGASAPTPEASDPAPDSPTSSESPDSESALVRATTAAAWERLIVEVAPIRGLDRWESRLVRLEKDPEGFADWSPGGLPLSAEARSALPGVLDRGLDVLKRLDALPRRGARWGDWATALAGLARAALNHPAPVLANLAETEPMRRAGPFDLDAVRSILAGRFAPVETPRPGPSAGRVLVADVAAGRGRAFDVVAAPGFSEGLFPRRLHEDPVLPDRAREELPPGLALAADRVDAERLRLRLLVGAARRALFVTWSSVDVVGGREQVPSFYAAEVLRAGLGKIPTVAELRALADRTRPVIRGVRAPKRPADAIDRREFDLATIHNALHETDPERARGAAAYVLSHPRLAAALRQEWARSSRKWQYADGFLGRGPEARAALKKHLPGARSFSATGVQHFAECPYKFHLHSIVRLRPAERPETMVQLDPLTRGSLIHEVLFHLGEELRKRGLYPLRPEQAKAARACLEETLDRVAAQVRDSIAPLVDRVWRDQIDGIAADLRGFLDRETAAGATVEANELTFGMTPRGPASPKSRREPAKLPGGFLLHGSIDAVERLPDGRARITDYKTGRASTDGRKEIITAGGKALQPLLYGLALEDLTGRPAAEGRLYYMTMRGGYEETVTHVGAGRARNAFRSLIGHLTRAVTEGCFPAAPNPELHYSPCRSCDYLPICGPRPASHRVLKDQNARVLDSVLAVREMQ